MKDFSEKLLNLPTTSGVYIMLDEFGQILYIGKAKNLKNRVRSYFQNSVTKTEKTMLLVEKICDFQIILTNSEIEALVLENNLIKEHKPYYNILLKDDKTYPYIKINLKEDYPSVEVTRKLKNDKSKYFGPYMLGLSAKTMTELLFSVFTIRNCKGKLDKRKGQRECLNYHIKRCLAPCVGKVSKEDYHKEIKKVIDFLNGNDKDIKKILQNKIEAAANDQDFERAIELRENLNVLDKLVRKQVAASTKDFNMDVFSYATNGMHGVINYLVVRGGKILGSNNHPINEAGNASDLLSGFIMQFYDKNPIIADEIIVSEELLFANELKDYLSHKKGFKVNVVHPKQGVRGQLVDLSYNNAERHLEETVTKIAAKETLTRISVQKLQESLNLPKPPKRMECFDISNISGRDKVASMVVFINGEPHNEMYRRFKIKTVKGIDDFKSMKEVIGRRVGELTKNDVSFCEFPDLIVVDGGKGQLSSAWQILCDTGINAIGLAKREEEIFLPNNPDPVILDKNNPALKLLQRLRDEAHRFAITYHRKLRGKGQTKSILTEIEGIGNQKARQLLLHFKKLDNIASASINDIMEVKGFGESHARAVKEFFDAKGEI